MFTSAEGRELMRGLEETGHALAAQFSLLDETTAAASPEGEEWSVKQNIAHISETEPGLVEEALAIAAQPGSLVGHPPGALWGEAQYTANGRPLGDLIREFETVNRETLRRVAALADDDLTKPGRHRGYGDVTVHSTLMVVLQHRRAHLFQNHSDLISLRARQEGRVPAEAYTVTGDGGPVLLLLEAAASRWDPVVGLLSDGYRTVHYKFAALPGDIERLCGDLELGKVWVAGTAGGATDAYKFALTHPERPAGLVLVNLSILPLARDGRPDDFDSVAVPTLSIVGAGHPHAVYMQERGRQFPRGRVVVVPGAGRDVPREQPEAVAQAIRDFVRVTVGT